MKKIRLLAPILLILTGLTSGITLPATANAIPAYCFTSDMSYNITSGSACSGPVTIPTWVTSIGANSFMNNANITSLTFAARTTQPLSIGYAAFANAVNLRGHLEFPSTTTAIGQYAFYETNLRCYTNLSSVVITTQNLDNTKQVPECGPYTVTYDSGGGTGTLPTQSSVMADETFTVAFDVDTSSSLYSVTQPGYTFLYWSDGLNTYYPNDPYTMSVWNVTLTAIWSEDPPMGPSFYDVYFEANDGNFPSDNSTEKIVSVEGGMDALSSAPTQPTRSGYDFAGWSSDESTVDTAYYVSGNLYLYALWTRIAGGQVTVSSISFATSPAIYQQSNLITAPVGESAVVGWVGFFQNGRSIPKCTKVSVNTSTRIATCSWKPANIGTVSIAAVFTPKSGSYTSSSKKTTSVRVVRRS